MELTGFEISYIALTFVLTPIVVCGSVTIFATVYATQIPAKVLVLSQATIDAIHACILPFYTASVISSTGIQNPFLCVIVNRVTHYTCGTHFLFIAAMILDYYRSLAAPQEHAELRKSLKLTLLVIFLWIFPLLITLVPVFAEWYSDSSVVSGCSVDVMEGKTYVLNLTMLVFPACVTIWYSCSSILHQVSGCCQSLPAGEFTQSELVLRGKVKSVAMLTTIAALCLLPVHIYAMVGLFERSYHFTILHYFVFLSSVSSLTTPGILTSRYDTVKTAFLKLYCITKFCKINIEIHKESVQPSTTRSQLPSTSMRGVSHFQTQLSHDDNSSLQDEAFVQDFEWVRQHKRSSCSSIVSRPQRISGGSIMTNSGKVLTVPSLVLEDIEGVSSSVIPIDVPVEVEEEEVVSSASIDLKLAGDNGPRATA